MPGHAPELVPCGEPHGLTPLWGPWCSWTGSWGLTVITGCTPAATIRELGKPRAYSSRVLHGSPGSTQKGHRERETDHGPRALPVSGPGFGGSLCTGLSDTSDLEGTSRATQAVSRLSGPGLWERGPRRRGGLAVYLCNRQCVFGDG